MLYLQSNDSYLYALNASNGATLWQVAADVGLGFGISPGLVISDGVVYAESADSASAYNLTSAFAASKQLTAPNPTALHPTKHLKLTPSEAS